jgi:YD repeat-containing protein
MKTFNDICAQTRSLIRQSINTRIASSLLLCAAVLVPAGTTFGGYPPDPCDSDPCGSGCDGALHPCCINEGDPCCDAGPPRPWQAAIPAGPFSVVTGWSGNLFTAVPIVGFSGRGPDIGVVLYHDSTCVEDAPSNGFGVDLGPGWTMSYTGHIEYDVSPPRAVVVEDDGTRNAFDYNLSQFHAPPGVFDTLELDTLSLQWVLTRKGLSKRIFDLDGRLVKIYDSSSNGLTVNWKAGENMDVIDYVEDDAGRQIEYVYATSTDRLIEIKDPANMAAASGWSRAARSWNLHYVDSNGLKLTEIRDPVYGSDAPIIFGYNDDGRITAVTDQYTAANRAGKAFGYEYDGQDRVSMLHDPSELSNSAQEISYLLDGGTGELLTIYKDRRGNYWIYRSNQDASLKSLSDPLAHVMTYERDNDFNVTTYTDALSHDWTYTYDDRGNLVTSTDPLLNVTSNSFDEYDNLTATLNAEDEEIQFFYDDAHNPTLLTSIVEPDDGVNGQGVTELLYYSTNGASTGESNGALGAVIDPNGAITFYKYDQFGHQEVLYEGAEYVGESGRSHGDPGITFDPGDVTVMTEPVGLFSEHGDNSGVRKSGDSSGNGAGRDEDALGRDTESTCEPYFPGRSRSIAFNPSAAPAPTGPWQDNLAAMQGYPTGQVFDGDISYTPQSQITHLENFLSYPNSGSVDREFSQTFDALGRKLTRDISADLSTSSQRSQSFAFNDSTGQSVNTVDGETYTYQVDDAGRMSSVTGPDSTATYTYYDNNQVKKITYGNGAYVEYEYLNNGWLEKITNAVGHGSAAKTLEYFYDDTGRIIATNEQGFDGLTVNQNQYLYDARGRLTREVRYGTGVFADYDITYTYDGGGNRKSKRAQISGQDDVAVDYFYDTDPDVSGRDVYGSFNNRLMYYVTSNGTEPVETTWYSYTPLGNVSRIISKKEGENLYRGTRLEYDSGGRLWRASGDQWENDWHFELNGLPLGFLLTDEEMTLDNAQAFAESIGGDLAFVDDPNILAWLASEFAPKDGSEATYWLGGYQVETDLIPGVDCGTSGLYPCCTPETNCTGDSAWCWWQWDDHANVLDSDVLVDWVPADKKCPNGSSCFFEDIYSLQRYQGGWLYGEPDDGDCDLNESGVENRMVMKFNVNGNATSHGFADVNTSGLRRALISRVFPFANDPNILDGDPTYSRLWAREFRYDGPRQRYLVRELSSVNMAPISDGIWTEYVGDTPMADYQPSGGGQTELKRYNPGASETDIASGETAYLHSDHLASTWFATDDPASGPITVSRRAVRTAFGEIVYVESPVESRYGYAGGWGYETHDIDSNGAGNGTPDNTLNAPAAVGFPFMHVGARYYDPGTGRFLQRDPIGIAGGLNVYAYVGNSPLYGIDPSGLFSLAGAQKGATLGLVGSAIRGAPLPIAGAIGLLGFVVGGWEESDFDYLFCAYSRNQMALLEIQQQDYAAQREAYRALNKKIDTWINDAGDWVLSDPIYVEPEPAPFPPHKVKPLPWDN